MIAEIRQHIISAIKSCSKEYKEIKIPFFQVENLIGSKEDYQYHIEMGEASKVFENDSEFMETIPVTLRTFRQGKKDKTENFDDGYCQALMIRSLILDRSGVNSKEYIKGINSSSVVPLEVPNSQDIYSYESTLIFTISYGIGD